jgi:hypothetical protein
VNLQAVAAPLVAAVNPTVFVTYRKSVGYSTDSAYTQQPQYADFAGVPCQIQPVPSGELRRLSGLNQQASYQKIYLNGDAEGVVRSAIKGGDLFVLPDNTVWLATNAMENWSDWTAVIVTLQNGG